MAVLFVDALQRMVRIAQEGSFIVITLEKEADASFRRVCQVEAGDGGCEDRDQLVRSVKRLHCSRADDIAAPLDASMLSAIVRLISARPLTPPSLPHRCHPLPLPHPRPCLLHHPRFHQCARKVLSSATEDREAERGERGE